MISPSIFSYIKEEENSFDTQEIKLGDNWEWNFSDHVQMILHLKNGVFLRGENDWLRPFKNIMEPMLKLSYWTEDIEVKDVVFFIEGQNDRVLSFLIKKYHDEVFSRENDLDTFFDELTESDIDYGGSLIQNTGEGRPEVIPLNSIAFADQTNILGGPLGLKFNFSPESLRKMSARGWGDEANGADISIDDLIILSDNQKDAEGVNNENSNRVTGKTIEVYIVRGALPEHYLLDNDNMEDWYNQVQVVAYYTNKKGMKEGVHLYRKKDVEENVKFYASQKIHGRALGRGDGETLLHPQVWTNFLNIHKTNMLEAGSKVPLMTDDPTFQNRQKVKDMENLEITTVQQGTAIPPQPIQTMNAGNYQLFDGAVDEQLQHAQLAVAAFDPVLGKEAVSGTTFRGQERTVAQGRGFHDRRRGQRAKFIEEVYRDYIIPKMIAEITGGKEFLASLTPDELIWISDQLTINRVNEKIKERLLNGETVTREEKDQLQQFFKKEFSKGTEKKLIKILKGQYKDKDVRVGINVANKQKDLVQLSDKILSVFQFAFANPQGFQQAMQIPALAKSFQDILEFSGMNQVDFMSLMQAPQAQISSPQGQEQPQQGAPQLEVNPAPAQV